MPTQLLPTKTRTLDPFYSSQQVSASRVLAKFLTLFFIFRVQKIPMAILKSNYNGLAFYVLGVVSMLLLVQRGDAYEFKVGGSSGWAVPSNDQNYNQWAENNRFSTGDTLLFVFPSDKDSVLQVTKEHYTNCTTEKPIVKFTHSPTVFKFNQSGPFYFISGTKDNCLNNEKLHVVVLTDRTGSKTSPPPSPTDSDQSPAPTSDEGQTQTPPNSGATSSIMSFMGLFVGFSFVLGF